MTKREVAIIHYNTPELTEATIKSLRKHGGWHYHVTLFDNSDKRPFTIRMRGVTVIDNTQGKIIDFDKELSRYPDRVREIGCAKGCEFGSAKHMMTVQKLWDLLPDGFLLLESDVLIKKNIECFFRPEYSFVGHVQREQPYNPFRIGRIMPLLCWMNVPMLKREGARYFDPARTYGLLPGGKGNRNNWYDTGAPMLEDVLTKRPRLKGLHMDVRPYIEHFTSGSWQKNDLNAHTAWFNRHKDLWDISEKPVTVAICAIGRLENRYAKEWVDHYMQLGIHKIFLYDNNQPEDGEYLSDVLKDYIDSGWIDIKPWDGLQKPAYEDCYNLHGKEYTWIGFIDFDEFLTIEDGRKLPDFLKDYSHADVLVINWKVMTDNGLLHYDPRPVQERFTEAAPHDYGPNAHVKCFVQDGISGISFNDPHCPNAPKLRVVNVKGEEVPQIPIQKQIIHEIAWLRHYETKSTEEYISIKIARGSCNGDDFTRNRRAHAVEYYFGLNKRTPEKEEILGVKPSQQIPAEERKPSQKKRQNKKKK